MTAIPTENASDAVPGLARAHLASKLVRQCSFEAWDGAKLVIFSACDVAYLPNAMALIRSLDLMSPGFDFLLHVVNPVRGTLEALDRLADELTSTRLHLSAEKVELGEERKTYFACARFLFLPTLLANSTVPVFVMDADGLFVAPIDLNFSDKTHADMCLSLRRVQGDEEANLHLKVAAGAVWVRPGDRTREFFKAVRADLLAEFATGSADWFLDQRVIGKHVNAHTGSANIVNLKAKYIDWNFRGDAIVWTGKGNRKHLDAGYLLLQTSFDSDPDRRSRARRLWQQTVELRPAENRESAVARVFKKHASSDNRRIGIYLPRLDLPWKQAGMRRGGPAVQSPEAIELRLWWKRFTMELALAITRSGFDPKLLEIPAWDITPERVDEDDVSMAFIPHRCQNDFDRRDTPVMFYMQEYFADVFVADPDGWSAASSVYPLDADALPPAVLGAWDEYRTRYRTGVLRSKFGQRPPLPRESLVRAREIPESGYAFFPLQIPHDQSLQYFSDIDQWQALEAVAEWASRARIALVLKGHPANLESMKPFRERFSGPGIHWSNAHVHDLLRYSRGVITLNSGVGFEAIIAGRPLVTMARAEYDCAGFKADPSSIAQAWGAATGENEDLRLTRYSRFIDWFLSRHAVDLSRPHSARYVIDRIVRQAIAMRRIPAGEAP